MRHFEILCVLTGRLTLFGLVEESNVCFNTLKCLMLLIDATSLMGIEKNGLILYFLIINL